MADDTRTIRRRYATRADTFERLVRGVRHDRWEAPSPCQEWTARDVVAHVIEMHGVMLRPLRRPLSRAPDPTEDPLGAYRAARADVTVVLDDTDLAETRFQIHGKHLTVAEHIDGLSDDLVLHGWDLARATGQDDTIDPDELDRLWDAFTRTDPDTWHHLRTPGAAGPDVVVFGPEVPVPADAPRQHRLLGMIGRDPQWRPTH